MGWAAVFSCFRARTRVLREVLPPKCPAQLSCLLSFLSPTGEHPAALFLGKLWHTAHEAFEWAAEQDQD